MTESAAARPRGAWPQSLPIYYGWMNVVVAALAMTATLPGRTHGLGLVTEQLLADLQLDRVWFARINLIGSLIGALFSLPAGRQLDRYGARSVLVGVTLALAFSVIGMSLVEGAWSLLFMLILVRGLGQSALSVASMAIIGKWFRRRLGVAMGAFAVLLTFGFIVSVLAMGAAVERLGWRAAWQDLGLALLALVPLFCIFARSSPESCGIVPDAPELGLATPAAAAANDFTLRAALRTPIFWIVALGTSAFNLVWSGVTLFNESMLAERGLDQHIAVEIMAILTGTGLLANLVAGAAATRARIGRLLAVGLLLLTVALAIFPSIDSATGARVYAAAVGLSGGVITVVFFAAWGHLFGRSQLGRIQGVAQFATVLASALGPVVIAEAHWWTGSYSLGMYGLAAATAVCAVAATLTPPPSR